MSREFVDNVMADNNVSAEKAFNDTMTAKVGDSLEIKRKEISQTFVSNPILPEEEVETDDWF